MEEESWIEKSAKLLRGEGFISLLGRIADNFGKERISPWNIGVDTCIKINIFDPARSYICNNITTFASCKCPSEIFPDIINVALVLRLDKNTQDQKWKRERGREKKTNKRNKLVKREEKKRRHKTGKAEMETKSAERFSGQ